MPKSKKVVKELSPEEMTKISNIQSLLEELLQMGGTSSMDTPTEEEPVMDAEAPMTEEESTDETMDDKEVKEILKSIEETATDASSASDDAEERMSDVLSEQDEENISEVEKTLLKALVALSKGKVAKSKRPQSPVLNVLSKMVAVQKSQKEQIDDLSSALGNVLKGIGVFDQIDSSPSPAKEVQVSKSLNKELIEALSILKGDRKEAVEPESSQGNQVRKNLANASVLSGLLGRIPGQRTNF